MKFDFNLYSSLLLIGFVQGIIFSFLLLLRYWRQRRWSDFFLGALLLICCLRISQYMLGFAGWYDTHDTYTTFMFYAPFHNLFWIGPLVYFYFLSVTNQQFELQPKGIWHFVPGIIYLAVFALIFLVDVVVNHWITGDVYPHFNNTKGFFREYWELNISFWYNNISILHIIPYLVLTLKAFRKYRAYLLSNFADTEDISFNWLANMLYAILISMGMILAISLYSNLISDLSFTQYWITHFLLAVMVYIVSIVGYRQSERLPRQLAFEPKQFVEIETKVTDAKEELPDLAKWKEKLKHLLVEEKIYLQPQLTLADLSSQLETNTSVLSKVINLGFEMNFNDLINYWRVEAVKSKMEDPKFAHLTLVGIALECGFNSKATFNRAFRKFTEKSPREYMQQISAVV
ncbi:MAG: helix-turn-helix domain-containing protein [Bacteroidia bacterium]